MRADLRRWRYATRAICSDIPATGPGSRKDMLAFSLCRGIAFHRQDNDSKYPDLLHLGEALCSRGHALIEKPLGRRIRTRTAAYETTH